MSSDEPRQNQNNNSSPTFSPPAPEAAKSETNTKANVQGQWEQYFGNLQDDYMKRVVDYAKQDMFEIDLKTPTGKTMKNPATNEEEPEYAGWQTKTYRRSKVRAKEWQTLETMRADFAMERNQKKAAELLARIYQYCAYLYLAMPAEEYERTDWEQLKLMVDGCNFRTVYGLPYSAKPSMK